jgi:GNAT superfamily N-acetyltransferase
MAVFSGNENIQGASRMIFRIRRGTEEDASAIARLATELGYPAPLDAMTARVTAISASGNDLLLVAVGPANEPVAWLQAHAAQILESGFRVEIVGLIVSTQARRCGVGRSLVDEAERWARNLHANTLAVRSDIKRAESHIFYPGLGFSLCKTQHVYRKVLDGS